MSLIRKKAALATIEGGFCLGALEAHHREVRLYRLRKREARMSFFLGMITQ